MKLIKIDKFDNGSHDNQITNSNIKVPDGWASIPDDMDTPNFPFGDIVVKDIDGIMTVIKWTPIEIPNIVEDDPEPTQEEKLRADIDYLAIMMGVEL